MIVRILYINILQVFKLKIGLSHNVTKFYVGHYKYGFIMTHLSTLRLHDDCKGAFRINMK